MDPPLFDDFHNPRSMQIFRGKRGRPEAWFWIDAQTVNGAAARYRLITFGEFGAISNDWLPKGTAPEDTVTLTLTNWEMGLANDQPVPESRSCLSEGKFGEFGELWRIEVTLNAVAN